MPRETAIKRLKRENAALHDQVRMTQQIRAKLLYERDKAVDHAADMSPYKRRVEMLVLEKARLQGYIDRVRETDGGEPRTSAIDDPFTSLQTATDRQRPITAEDVANMSEVEFGKLLLTAKPRLDALMGRNADDIDTE